MKQNKTYSKMIAIDKPMVTDLFIQRSDSSGSSIPRGTFGRKDIETILENYVTKEEFEMEIARLEALIENLNQ